MRLIFVGQGYPRKLFNLEHFPLYGMHFLPFKDSDNNRSYSPFTKQMAKYTRKP